MRVGLDRGEKSRSSSNGIAYKRTCVHVCIGISSGQIRLAGCAATISARDRKGCLGPFGPW